MLLTTNCACELGDGVDFAAVKATKTTESSNLPGLKKRAEGARSSMVRSRRLRCPAMRLKLRKDATDRGTLYRPVQAEQIDVNLERLAIARDIGARTSLTLTVVVAGTTWDRL